MRIGATLQGGWVHIGDRQGGMNARRVRGRAVTPGRSVAANPSTIWLRPSDLVLRRSSNSAILRQVLPITCWKPSASSMTASSRDSWFVWRFCGAGVSPARAAVPAPPQPTRAESQHSLDGG